MREFFREKQRLVFFLLAVFVGATVTFGVVFLRHQVKGKSLGASDVIVPTIVNGELVLPKVATTDGNLVAGLGKTSARLGVNSANLIGVYDSSANSGQVQKLTAIRIIGETTNIGEKIVSSLSPYVRFFDKDGKVLGQKIGRNSDSFTFFDLLPGVRTYYDVTVDNPPVAEKLEIVLNVASASDSALFEQLKIASRSMEVKTATYQGNATGAAGQKVEYYTVSGMVVNALSDPVSDIAIYAWVKNGESKVFSFGRQDFKNDLLAAGDKIGFKIMLLPFKDGESYSSYEVAAWGKRYRLNL